MGSCLPGDGLIPACFHVGSDLDRGSESQAEGFAARNLHSLLQQGAPLEQSVEANLGRLWQGIPSRARGTVDERVNFCRLLCGTDDAAGLVPCFSSLMISARAARSSASSSAISSSSCWMARSAAGGVAVWDGFFMPAWCAGAETKIRHSGRVLCSAICGAAACDGSPLHRGGHRRRRGASPA